MKLTTIGMMTNMKLTTIGMMTNMKLTTIGMMVILIILSGCITNVQENANIPTPTPVSDTIKENTSKIPNTTYSAHNSTSSTSSIDNVENYNDKDIYIWDNIYIVYDDDEKVLMISSSSSKLKSFLDFTRKKKESGDTNTKRPDPKSTEKYHDYDIAFFELEEGNQLWNIRNFMGDKGLLALEKETLVYIVDNKDSFMDNIEGMDVRP